MLKEYYKDNLNAREAKEEIQKLSFYPMMFQAARVMRTTGILNEVFKKRRNGITPNEIVKNLSLPYYGVNTLLETGLTIGLVYLKKKTPTASQKWGTIYYLMKLPELTLISLMMFVTKLFFI